SDFGKGMPRASCGLSVLGPRGGSRVCARGLAAENHRAGGAALSTGRAGGDPLRWRVADAARRRTDRRRAGGGIAGRVPVAARGLYDTCRNDETSMSGLGPAVAMLTALNALGEKNAELVKYATSADVSLDRSQVVGYAGMIFS